HKRRGSTRIWSSRSMSSESINRSANWRRSSHDVPCLACWELTAKVTPMIRAEQALIRLKQGNGRFVAGRQNYGLTDEARRNQLVYGQEPFAIILGCSDSRVPAEIVFDQGLGDLFVIRVAGNVVAPSQVGSVEFAA